MISVAQFMRKPNTGNFSVERLYSDVRSNLPSNINCSTRINTFFSKGIFKRLADSFLAIGYQKDINHITGDVHYLSLFLKRKKTILTILDCVGLERSKGLKFFLMWFFWYWLPEKRVSKIIVISESTKNQFLRYTKCSPDKIKVIHCNVADSFFKHTLSFNQKNPRILHIGTGENKNLLRHIYAVKSIPCTLVIIGVLSEIHLKALENNKISFENYIDLSDKELMNEYVKCDLLIFSSLYEGFGMPIIESQAIGRPVITSNIWSMPEVAGEGALLVNPYDVDDIKDKVNKLIFDEDIRNSCIENGFENIKRFSSKFISEEYAKVYEQVYLDSK